jgi:F-type H+-transporting ATPase subunit b
MTIVVRGLPQAQEQPASETQQEEEHNPILPEVDELIFGGLAFLLVFVVLARVAFPRLNQGLEQRRRKIQEDLEKAERTKSEADQLRSNYEDQLREARGEANRVVEEARKTADSVRRDLLAKAEEESRQIVARAQEEIRAERDRASDELRRSVAELSIQLAERVVGESLTQERHLKLVDGYIDEISKRNGGERGPS